MPRHPPGLGLLWLLAAFAATCLFTAWTMAPAFGADDVVQDDARQHVFWLHRFRDGELLRNDFIADYYQSVAPAGYSGLYWLLTRFADPLEATKLLPPLLGLAVALFTFLTVRHLHPWPGAAFLAAVLMSRYAWQHSALASATPRAFLLPLLAALLWTLVSGRRGLAVGVVGLSALLYPVAAALGLALLGARLVRWRGRWPALSRRRQDWAMFLAACGLVGLVLLPGQLVRSPFGPTISGAQARTMPEFGDDGPETYFVDDWYTYWLKAQHSGLDLSVVDARFRAIPILYEHAALAALLPLILLVRPRPAGVRRLAGQVSVLPQLLLASFGLFFLAHLLLFHIFFPGRYVKWSLPLVLSVAGGLGLAILIEALAGRFSPGRRSVVAGALALAVGFVLIAYPGRWQGKFLRDPNPDVTTYLRAQPKDVLVAGTPNDVDFVPSFAGRSILVGREYLLPYHLGYYAELRQRTEALIEAYYAESPAQVAEFADRYGVDLFLVNRFAYDRQKFTDAWGSGFEPYLSAIRPKLEGRRRYALLEATRRCAAVDEGAVAVVPTSCLRG